MILSRNVFTFSLNRNSRLLFPHPFFEIAHFFATDYGFFVKNRVEDQRQTIAKIGLDLFDGLMRDDDTAADAKKKLRIEVVR